MSGWIKMEKDLRDDPRVITIAKKLRNADVTHARFTNSAHVTLVCGALYQLWSYADTHINNDDILRLGASEIDEIVGIQGFCEFLPEDWLQILDADSVKLPGFHAHNGTEAKKKALTQRRVSNHRKRVTPGRIEMKRSRNAEALPDQDQDQDQDQDHKKKNGKHVAIATDVGVVFDHWKKTHNHPRAQLDDKREKVIRVALAKYAPEELCRAIDGYKRSAYHMGENERRAVYDDIELFLRDAKHIDAGLKYAEQPENIKWQ